VALGVGLKGLFDFGDDESGDPERQALRRRLNEIAGGQDTKGLAALVQMAEMLANLRSS